MQKKYIYIILIIFLSGWAFPQKESSNGENIIPVSSMNEAFNEGERLDFKLSFGWFTIGNAYMEINKNNYTFHNKPNYKVDIYGKTSGLVDWINSVNDHWGAYIDKKSLLPNMNYRHIREGKYKLDEIITFRQDTNLIERKVKNKKTGKYNDPQFFESTGNVFDMLGGLLYVRTIDFDKMEIGQRFKIKVFFEDTFYDLSIIYAGKEQIKTGAGKFNAIKVIPEMPDNDLFDGENSITAWFSDDKNKVPLKFKAEMFIGSAGVELSGYSGLRNTISKIK
ncbi:MAG: DUF3108 domain-containing protein [Cyclobacteriaceae bacterium]|nr:DUF3108 domain-containing protein [Cyclobacteriaceae bacterium]